MTIIGNEYSLAYICQLFLTTKTPSLGVLVIKPSVYLSRCVRVGVRAHEHQRRPALPDLSFHRFFNGAQGLQCGALRFTEPHDAGRPR